VRFCPKCDSYLRFKRLPGGTGYWLCSSCSYSEGAPPVSDLEPVTPVKKTIIRHSPRKVTVDDSPDEDFDPAQARLKEIILRASPPLTPNQIHSLTDRGFITEFRQQYRLTPPGQQVLHISQQGKGPLTLEEVGFLNLLTHYPNSEDLQTLEKRGLISIQNGQPVLTPQGEALRVKLQKEYERKAIESKEQAQKKRKVSRNLY